MANTKRIDWARQQRLRAIAKRNIPVAGKPVLVPVVIPAPVTKPIIVPVIPKAPGPKPEQRVDHRLPYTKKRGEYICELCERVLKTEAGIVAHVRAKHPEVGL